jgi:hypothetical protein
MALTLGAFITITRPLERGDLYLECAAQAKKLCDKVTVIDGEESWPQEFDWPLIGHHFQAGYVSTEADWVLHLDTDFILHEEDFSTITAAIKQHNDSPALSFWKYQFILPDRYNLKSRLAIAVNKGKYGNRIRFDSGGDLCQPSLDGRYIEPGSIPEARVPIYNYEKLLKTKQQLAEDCGRMERAYHRHFHKYQMGSNGSNQSALEAYFKLVKGRFTKPQELVPLSFHPEIMRGAIANLAASQFGYDGLGNLEQNSYAREKRG